uniref:Uncharacterized protein n=1 Tax=Globisporangium ultimum (strain ATCC 200006 / CBS 805.95 / DAOM BR144) TaxID=431595 RepID=K3X708_GLOUD
MSDDRVRALLAHATIVDALHEDDIAEVLSDVASLSEQYIPTLQFLMRPDNLVGLIKCMLQAPASASEATPRSIERSAPSGGEFPCYDEYAIVYRAHWVLCASGFSSQLIAAIVGLQTEWHTAICVEITRCNSRDTMIVEALSRFLNTFMDQYSPESLLAFVGAEHQHAFLETLLVLIYYEPIRDVLLRVMTDLPDSIVPLQGVMSQFLYQLAPWDASTQALCTKLIQSRIADDLPHQIFSRMVFTCDLLTDLIHERRTGSLGFFYVAQLSSSLEFATRLIDAAAEDLRVLPTAFANESYAVKVLNSLLQQSQCGCVTKAAFLSHTPPSEDGVQVSLTEGSPHEDLPMVWKQFITRLSEFVTILNLPPQRHFKTIHVQVIYLMLPILNVSCTAIDEQLVVTKTMECLLALISRFPGANILHCAISRLFIVALEDSPFMFGKELPAFRAANDPLRLHLLLHGCFETVLSAFGTKEQRVKPPPAFLDIAISFDQAMTTAQAHSPHLFLKIKGTMDAWNEFRASVLLPTQTLWEEQYEPPALPDRPKRASTVEFLGPASEFTLLVPGVFTKQEQEEEQINCLQRAIAEATGTPMLGGMTSADLESEKKKLDDDEIPTPLSALYNDEERFLMLRVASTSSSAPSSPVPPVSSYSPLST